MKKDLESHLNRLAWDVTSIGNFNYAQEYGYSRDLINSHAHRMAQDIPGVFEVMDSTYPIVEVVNIDAISSIDINEVSKWEKKFRTILKKLRKDDSYKALLRAYNEDNQNEIADLLPLTFVDLRVHKVLSPKDEIPWLFHGVTMRKDLNPEKYLSLCLKIKNEGLRPSPYDLHIYMDKHIRPVFVTPDIYVSHGLISFKFKPNSYAVVLENNGSEARIYTKKLKTNLELFLRDADTLQSHGPDELGIEIEKAQEYIPKLKSLLNEKEIPFRRIKLPKNR